MYLHAKLELDFPFLDWLDLSHPHSHLQGILAAAQALHPHNWLPQVNITQHQIDRARHPQHQELRCRQVELQMMLLHA
jgi:hypothetical protein